MNLSDFIDNWLKAQAARMPELLAELVGIDSFSRDIDGVTKMAHCVCDTLTRNGIKAQVLNEFSTVGVLADVGDTSLPAIALTGHLDTVFATGEVAKRPYQTREKLAYGPGVADMKAGIVMNCFIMMALRAYEQESATLLPFHVRLLATTDEEVGSPNGRKLIQRYLARTRAVFNAEPGRVSGNVVTARKGGSTYDIEVTGRAAHSGVNHQDGVSAIGVLAKLISAIHALTDYEAGITTNVGVVSGGTTPNTVAAHASAKLDVRFMNTAQGEEITQILSNYAAQYSADGAQVSIKPVVGFLPLEAHMSESLLRLYREQAQQIGLNIDGEFTGGCSDAGWTSHMGIPTLCATGPVGANAHTEREYCDLSTLLPRAQIIARCVTRLGLES